jgi:hypothetical protein
MTLRALLRASLIALALLPIGALAAHADDGRPPSPEAGRPPTSSPVPITQLRPSEIRVAPIGTLVPNTAPFLEPTRVPRQKELVIFVGGYASRADDGAFDVLAARFPSDQYDVVRLGQDPRFPYDTYGTIPSSARSLTDEVRALSPGYAGVNIVTHSMGGVVADRAIADGLTAADGVRTYVAIAAPHSGADIARVPNTVLPLIAPVKEIIRAIAVVAARDPESVAIRDIANTKPVAPPAGIARLDVSLATDGFVNEYDAHDPGIEQRLFLPSSLLEVVDGHGGSLRNRQIAELVTETIRTHRVPPDRRDLITRMLAPILWDRETWFWRTVLLLAAVGAIALYAARFMPFCRDAFDRVNSMCRQFLHAVGR